MPKRTSRSFYKIASLILIVLLACFSADAQNLVPFREHNKYGWVDLSGKIVVPAAFKKTFPFVNGLARFKAGDYFGYLGTNGKIAIHPNYDAAWDFNNGMARVKEGPVLRFINKRGKEIFSVYGEDVTDFNNGYAIVKYNGSFYYINRKGESLGEGAYSHAEPFENGLARVKIGFSYAMIDTSGNYVLSPTYGFVGRPHDVIVRARLLDDWYIYNHKNGRRIRSKHIITGDFNDGLATYSWIDRSYIIWKGYINALDQEVIKAEFEEAMPFRESRAVVKHEGVYKIIDKSGSFIGSSYDETRGIYSEGRLAARKNGKWGFVDRDGNWAVNPKYDAVEDFKDGFAMVSKGHRKWGMIDKQGELLVPTNFDIVMPGEYYFLAILGYYKSYYSRSGELIIEDIGE